MNVELTRISPRRAAKVSAIFYGALTFVMSLPMLAMFQLIPEPPVADGEEQALFLSVFRWMPLVYPVFSVLFGWFFGFIGAWLYNAIAKYSGGLQVQCFDEATDRTSAPHNQPMQTDEP